MHCSTLIKWNWVGLVCRLFVTVTLYCPVYSFFQQKLDNSILALLRTTMIIKLERVLVPPSKQIYKGDSKLSKHLTSSLMILQTSKYYVSLTKAWVMASYNGICIQDANSLEKTVNKLCLCYLHSALSCLSVCLWVAIFESAFHFP